ncbi:MAG TPA: 50S ribosomal protein L33 [Candidatus Hydrogenedentes bacterium]|nr:50S ribosomal protein L33 [Candidatus Hydrogenedentota bacterium]HPG70078.1 50S ribosomal protein L33 [Candidatus Hydrogenedentota bacterium]
MREIVTLECTECKRRNYMTTRDKRKKPERLVLKKYCRFDRKHTEHRETR